MSQEKLLIQTPEFRGSAVKHARSGVADSAGYLKVNLPENSVLLAALQQI
ncbi:hypothetical protein METHB2_710019 [Candidatus Methylobacter favarea]|uniref:Uncharacterized protein n=1 Tax=Candidatus Methylobacter favarea TaxID=2707345 RepID=A0A8S0WCI3_9GAMM|nr:hypothetical protein METHB2_710019 [Candidatus Methylobacter favarea]